MRTQERRNISARAAIVQRVLNGVVQNPSVTLTVDTLQAWLDIPMEAAQRILGVAQLAPDSSELAGLIGNQVYRHAVYRWQQFNERF